MRDAIQRRDSGIAGGHELDRGFEHAARVASPAMLLGRGDPPNSIHPNARSTQLQHHREHQRAAELLIATHQRDAGDAALLGDVPDRLRHTTLRLARVQVSAIVPS
jgi:hypothetical protein